MFMRISSKCFYVKDSSTKEVLLQGINKRGLHKLIGVVSITTGSPIPTALTVSVEHWYSCLGHLSFVSINTLANKSLVEATKVPKKDFFVIIVKHLSHTSFLFL